ncbi:MAG: lytic transglycosylase domain-containing protein [Nannocystaceae bacterium]
MELARGLDAWAAVSEPADADKRLAEAAKALSRGLGHKPIRNLAEMRVMQARVLAKIDGGSASGRRGAALRAEKALRPVIADYPYHPEIGELQLLRARALVRAGRLKDGEEALRSIAIRRAGEPESTEAEVELQALADAHYRGKVHHPSLGERLERAESARGLRNIELSRSLLDAMIDDPKTPPATKMSARRSRAWTAYKARDYATCADDLRIVYDDAHSIDTREFLARCLDRGAMYEEAMKLWLGLVPSKGAAGRQALWAAIEQAYRAGRYAEGLELLARYDRKFKGHRAEREWLSAWMKMRSGDREGAIAGLAHVEKTQRSEAVRAAYFRGRLLLAGSSDEEREQGRALLKKIVDRSPLEYYGLMARQRLLDAGADPGPVPAVKAVAGEGVRPDEQAARDLFRALAQEHGEALPALVRGQALHAAGYEGEARRELRIAIDEFVQVTGSGGGYEPRHEDRIVGLAWRGTWQQPKLAPTKEARKTLRKSEVVEPLRAGLRTLAASLEDPHRFARLSNASDGPARTRWYIRAYRRDVEREAAAQSIEPVHLWSLMYTESRFRSHVISAVGARGVLQIMPWTGEQLVARLGEASGRFDTDRLFDPPYNIHLAAYYAAELLKKFHGQAAMAYASYNGGPSNVARWLAAKSKGPVPLELDVFIEEIPFGESARYTRRVLETQAIYSLLYQGALPRWTNAVDPAYEDNIDF